MLLTLWATYPRLRAISPGSPSQATFINYGARMALVVFKSSCDADDTDDDDDDVFLTLLSHSYHCCFSQALTVLKYK